MIEMASQVYLTVLLAVALLHAAQVLGQNYSASTPKIAPSKHVPGKKNSSSSLIHNVTVSRNLSSLNTVSSGSVSPNFTHSVSPNFTHSINASVSSTVSTNKTHTMSVNVTSTPGNMTASVSSTVSPPGSTTTTIHSSVRPTPTKASGKSDKDYDNMKKRMWIAASFAIIFAIATVILAYLVYRQRKINRELEGDPSTSRLL